MIARVRAHLRLRMTTRLVIGFLALMLITLAMFLVIIGMLMRQRMYQTADQNLRNQADTLLNLLGAQEQALAHEAALISNLDGISDALANQDHAQLNRLIIPVAMSHGLDSMYVLDDKRQILFRLGDAITHDALLPRLPIVERGFEFLAATSPLESNDVVWLVSVAARRQPRGKTDAVFVLGKRLDQPHLAGIRTLLGSHVGILWGNTAVFSFAHPPSELSIAHLRASQHEIAEYSLSNFAFHDMPIEGMPYRVAAFTYFARDGGYINTFLFLPTTLLVDSMNQATTGVIALGMLISALGIGLVYLYARGITQPLNRLERAATDIAQGNLEHVVRVENQDEIGMLAQAFEQMRLRVRAMLQAQQQWNVELETQVRAKTSALEELIDWTLATTLTNKSVTRPREGAQT
jgi:HAMP domain-containing protein